MTQHEDGLSEKEREVMELVVAGKANKEIARELGMAEPTVKGHLESIFAKYDVHTRTQAAIEWLRRTGRAE